MGFTKNYTRKMADAGTLDKVQTLTSASTGTRINNYGVTLIINSSAGNNTFIMDAPRKGVRKTLMLDPNSTGDLVVAQATTSILWYGSTANIVTASSGTGVKVMDLIGISATEWGVISRTTGLTLAGSTISG